MSSEDRPGRRGPASGLLRGLNASITGNAQAFGFSVTVTVTFGVLNAALGSPGRLELLGFALAAVAAFSLLNVAVIVLMRDRDDDGPADDALLVSTATDLLAVGAAVGAALGLVEVLSGWVAWTVVPFLASAVYAVGQSIELAVGRKQAEDGDGAVGQGNQD